MPPTLPQRPVRQNVRTVPSDDLMGKGSWVKIRAMSVAEHTLYQGLIRGSRQLADSKEATVEDLMKNETNLRQVICHCLLEWNWVDDNGNDMPQPYDNPAVIEALTQEELTFLMESILNGASTAKKKLKTSK